MEAALGLVGAASLLGAMASLGASSHLCTLAVVAVTIAACAVSLSLRRCDSRNALTRAALPFQVVLPTLCLAAVSQLSEDVSRLPYFTCGTPMIGFPFLLVFVWWVGACVSRLIVAAVANHRAPITRGALRVVACVFALGLLGLATRAMHRAAWLPDSPDAWVAAQPVVGEIPAVTQAIDARSTRSDARRVGGVCVERQCELARFENVVCHVRVASECGSGPMPDSGARDSVPPGSVLRIRSARGLGAWLVEVSPHRSSGDVLAFAGSPPQQVAYDRGDIASELAPPRGWIIGGFVASALALLLALASFARRPFDPAGWQEAWHEGGGRLRVGDTTAFTADVTSLPVGQVIVRARQSGGAPFRTSAAVEAYEVVVGTLHDAMTRAALDAAAPALLALSSAAALGAPLLLAALLGRS